MYFFDNVKCCWISHEYNNDAYFLGQLGINLLHDEHCNFEGLPKSPLF